MPGCDPLSSGSSYAPGSQLPLGLSLPLRFLALEESSSDGEEDTLSITPTWTISRWLENVTDGVRVRIDVVTVGVSAKLFAYRKQPFNVNTGERVGTFSHVCSPVDLEEFPEDAPNEGAVPPWYRLDFVDIFVRSEAEADDFVKSVNEDLESLVYTLKIMNETPPARSGTTTFR